MTLNLNMPSTSGLLPELLYARCAVLSPIEPELEESLGLLVTPYSNNESRTKSFDDNKALVPDNADDTTSNDFDETFSDAPTTAECTSASQTTLAESELLEPSSKNQSNAEAVEYDNRNVLNLFNNLTDSRWKFQYAKLPENNLKIYMENRSQYHRLSNDGFKCEYDTATCSLCRFVYPIEKVFPIASHMCPQDREVIYQEKPPKVGMNYPNGYQNVNTSGYQSGNTSVYQSGTTSGYQNGNASGFQYSHANGYVNSHFWAYTNGLPNGHTNSHLSGRANGRTNNYANRYSNVYN